jgi:hypothetical protein
VVIALRVERRSEFGTLSTSMISTGVNSLAVVLILVYWESYMLVSCPFPNVSIFIDGIAFGACNYFLVPLLPRRRVFPIATGRKPSVWMLKVRPRHRSVAQLRPSINNDIA